MSAKLKFFLIILLGTAITTVGTVVLLNLASGYPETAREYYIFGGLGFLVLFGGIGLIVIFASRTAD